MYQQGKRQKQKVSIVLICAALVLLVLSQAGCGGSGSRPESRGARPDRLDRADRLDKLETVELEVGDRVFTVEVARTPEEREQGLMWRTQMGEYEGMLFVFERDQRLSFWMKNTYIPLSIAYIAADGTIREIHPLEPESLTPVESTYSVRYALELNRNAFERANAGVGDTIEIPRRF